MSTENPNFEQWAVISLMGHVSYAGLVEDVSLFGQQMIRLTVPESGSLPTFQKIINPTAVYDITPVSEDYAREYASRLRKQPVEAYEHQQVMKVLASEMVEKLTLDQVAKITADIKEIPAELDEK